MKAEEGRKGKSRGRRQWPSFPLSSWLAGVEREAQGDKARERGRGLKWIIENWARDKARAPPYSFLVCYVCRLILFFSCSLTKYDVRKTLGRLCPLGLHRAVTPLVTPVSGRRIRRLRLAKQNSCQSLEQHNKQYLQATTEGHRGTPQLIVADKG
jgi:hypothetical protein